MTEREKSQETSANSDAIELVQFLRQNPPGYRDGKSIIALTEEQIAIEKNEKEQREKTRVLFHQVSSHLDDIQEGE